MAVNNSNHDARACQGRGVCATLTDAFSILSIREVSSCSGSYSEILVKPALSHVLSTASCCIASSACPTS
jgi:hypothetical protein